MATSHLSMLEFGLTGACSGLEHAVTWLEFISAAAPLCPEDDVSLCPGSLPLTQWVHQVGWRLSRCSIAVKRPRPRQLL